MSSGDVENEVANEFQNLGLQEPSLKHPPMTTFKDVTKEFIEASEQLNVGQLVQDPNFTLFQAVGALEIMDPKMDSGLLEPEYEKFDPWTPRLPEEIIGIMDRLLCDEVYMLSWHLGSALPQTLFANLYIDRLLSSCPMKLEQATFGDMPEDNKNCGLIQNVLRPYCIAIIRCCGYANQQISGEHIFEEEDFVPQTYGLPLLQLVKHREVETLLDSALEYVDKEAFEDPAISTALRSRLLLRKSLLKNFCMGGEDYLQGVPSNWDEPLPFIQDVVEWSGLAKDVPEAWSMSVQRKLASSVPPRPLTELAFPEAIKALRQLCMEMADIFRILDFAGANNTMTYFITFGAQRPTPLPYTRSLIQTLLFKDDKILDNLSVRDILLDDLKELCNPLPELLDPTNDEVEAPQNPKFQIAKRVNWFVERAGRAYVDLYRKLCQNRPRLRRLLCKTILDWDSLQVEAEDVDSELHSLTSEEPNQEQRGPMYSYTLSSWVYHYKLRMMEFVMLLGFELEIFPLHEMDGMYWYLRYYLNTRTAHLERILTFAGGNQKTLSLLNFHLLEASAMQDLTSGCVFLYTALARLGLTERPKDPQGSEKLAYMGRMKPFMPIGCPYVLEFDEFRAALDDGSIPTPELLEIAADHIKEAKTGYSQLLQLAKGDPRTARATLCPDRYQDGIQKLLKSAFGIGVSIATFDRALKDEMVVRVKLDRSSGYHPSFPVPLIGKG